jgi:hypothetical protein
MLRKYRKQKTDHCIHSYLKKKIRHCIQQEKAVSESIGFIYIFAIVMLSMSLIYMMGYPTLQSSMDACTFESSQQSFIILQSNMKMVAFNQAPIKNLNIQLQSATISIAENSDITIDYAGDTIHCVSGVIEYQQQDMFITYENGGVWKRYSDGGIMVSKPRIYSTTMNGTSYTTIGIVSLQGTSSFSGDGIANIRMQHNSSVINRTQIPVDVKLSINSTYGQQWKDFLEGIGFTTTNSTDTSLTVWKNNTILAVGRHVVDVDII